MTQSQAPEDGLSLTPTVWGPSTWTALHLMTLAYPEEPTEEDKKKHRAFLYALAEVLPCSVCQNHFRTRIHECIQEGALDTRESYVKCMWNIHRAVNPEKSITFAEFIDLYKGILERGHLNPIQEMKRARQWKIATAVSSGIAIGLLVALVYGCLVTKKRL
jgi:hypothetical protein